jgi:hypothetical protein
MEFSSLSSFDGARGAVAVCNLILDLIIISQRG